MKLFLRIVHVFQLLGSIFQDFLTRKEDYLRALRGFLREIVRVVRSEFNYTVFVRSLMQDRAESEFAQLEPPHKVSSIWKVLGGFRVGPLCLGRSKVAIH